MLFSVHTLKACSSDKRNTNEEYEVVHHQHFHYHTHSTSKEDKHHAFVSVKRKTVAGILQANLEIKMHHLRPAYEKRAITAFSGARATLRARSSGDWRRWSRQRPPVTHKALEMRGGSRAATAAPPNS